MRITPIAVAVALLLTTAGCAKPVTAGLSDADKAAIEAQEQLFAQKMAAGDIATVVASYYTADAMVLAPNAPIVAGSAAIEALFKSFGPVASASLQTDEIVGMGEVAYVRGHYTMTFTPPGAPASITDSGKYLEIFKKQADGSWKSFRDAFSSDLPLPPAPAPAKKK